jgi:hypothetical protein
MLSILSLVTSVKDYVEILHKLIETDSINSMNGLNSYYDFGAGTTFFVLTAKEIITNFLSLKWFQTIWSIPTLVPDIASAMISEISVFNGSFQNNITLLEQPISYGNQNLLFYCLEKFMIGAINSLFLCLPTSTAHIITLRRFVMQGLDAGYTAGLGTIAGNVVWIGSVVFGLQFLVIPWLSFDILRYLLGFVLLVKYMWDSYSERRSVLDDLSKYKIFILNFLLAFTEQTNLFPFLSNVSIGSDSTLLESFPSLNGNVFEFLMIHGFYLIGILVGSLSLLQLTCWFWENPAYNFYIWIISNKKVTTTFYFKFLNFFFLYLTMICAISNVTYLGLDYTITNPLGLTHEDRLVEQKVLLETSFLNSKASDRNTRRNRGRHGRRERWKRRVRRYRTFDASLYDQGIYDLFTIEDLNYGFDRFWLRRKIRNHRVRFRFFPGPWMRSFKKQLTRPRLESFMGPRIEFFRILFEQAYHPEFHEFQKGQMANFNLESTIPSKSQFESEIQTKGQGFEPGAKGKKAMKNTENLKSTIISNQSKESDKIVIGLENFKLNIRNVSIYFDQKLKEKKQNFITQNSALRKFLRKTDNRVKIAKIQQQLKQTTLFSFSNNKAFEKNQKTESQNLKPIYSKRWKYLFSKISHNLKKANLKSEETLFKKFYQNSFLKDSSNTFKKDIQKRLSKADRQILRYKTFLKSNPSNFASNDVNSIVGQMSPSLISNPQTKNGTNNKIIALSGLNKTDVSVLEISDKEQNEIEDFKKISDINKKNEKRTVSIFKDLYKPITLLHPIKYYLQQENAFKKKFNFYGVKQYRNFVIEKNAPYFRVMMKRFFYYYKPTLRWERTMRVATMRKARRKGSRIPRKLNINCETKALALAFNKNILNNENILNISNPSLTSEKSNLLKLSKIQKPTHFYSLVSKRASRYRYEIYKDVLQHWYYSPFNRLLLKFDVDSFIRRQPKAHFLTKKDETLLHFKRFLISEYYNSLRWYTYMQHYDSMKTKISGTKTLTSRVYNQQFHGTFKKIRHLFAITPFSNDQTILKFDQPLYNEFANNKNGSFLKDSVFHEEILADEDFKWIFSSKNINEKAEAVFGVKLKDLKKNSSLNQGFEPGAKGKKESQMTSKISPNIQDLKNQSAEILREYLKKSTPLRQEYIKNLLNEKNYSELTRFLFRGKKLRGISPITNEKDYLLQENEALLNKPLKINLFETNDFQKGLWFELIKKCHYKLYDQKALKNYVLSRVDKHEKQKQRKQKNLKQRLEKIQNWYISESDSNSNKNQVSIFNTSKEQSSKFKLKSEILTQSSNQGFEPGAKGQNQENGYASSYTKAIKEAYNISIKNRKVKQNKYPKLTKNQKILLKNYLIIRLKELKNKVLTLEKNFKETYISDKASILETKDSNKQTNNKVEKTMSFLIHKTLVPFESLKMKVLSKEGLKNISNNLNNKILNFLKKPKDLNQWRKHENVLSRRKKIRKTLKRLRNNKNLSSLYERQNFKNFKKFNPEIRKKRDLENFQTNNSIGQLYLTRREKTWQNYLRKKTLFFFKDNLFTKKFKKRRSRMRRYRFLKGRGPIKKRTLGEKLKGQFRFLKKYGAGNEMDKNDVVIENNKFESKIQTKSQKQEKIQNKKLLIFHKLLNGQIEKLPSDNIFETREVKQRRTRVRKHRYWKKHKKQKDALTRRKIKKRRRYGKSKIRVLNKKLKKLQEYNNVKKWWWQEFLPNFQEKTDKIWQTYSYNSMKNDLNLSVSEILKRDGLNTSILQIGEKDFKPLSIPEAIRIQKSLEEQNKLNFGNQSYNKKNDLSDSNSNSISVDIENIHLKKGQIFDKDQKPIENLNLYKSKGFEDMEDIFEKDSLNKIDQLSNNILTSSLLRFAKETSLSKVKNDKTSPFMVATNPIPFYAGWDESSRKFVVTNRLFSRKEAGYSFYNNLNTGERTADYLKAPLNGMNAPTTLYWQVPFTTYDPDQFFALGMDGFSPIGWRNFHFKFSKQTTKPILVKKIQSLKMSFFKSNFSKNLQIKFINKNFGSFNFSNSNIVEMADFNLKSSISSKSQFESKIQSSNQGFEPEAKGKQEKRLNQINLYKRIQKRYKRVKKHPRPPVWFPSGTLANQVLPVHYIYVFYKRYRLPRDRYVRRKLRRQKNDDLNLNFSNLNKWTDYTLRKRAKPKRKYHRKSLQMKRKNEDFLSHLKRRKFRGFADENDRFRPISESQKLKELKIRKKLIFKDKKNSQKTKKQKGSKDNLRLRQLRRRVQRQVFRPVWRYKPQTGGFVWPGDYLRLELVKAPKLQTTSISLKTSLKISEKQRNIRKKKRRIIQEWQIQPKKYLLQKHNLKVLKKRLQKSQN